jgi:tRNA nucleotidyltransferase (CCA-adding enzyme)
LKPGRQTLSLFKAVDKQVSWFMKKFSCYGDFEPWIIYFAVLLRPLSREEGKNIVRRLGFAATSAKKILGCRRIGSKLVESLNVKGIKPERVFSLLKPLSLEEIILLRSLCSDSIFRRNISDFLGVYNRLRLSITGDDLCGMGVMPGPEFRNILNRVLAARLNGKVGGRRQELALAGNIIRQLQQRSEARCPDMNV